MLSLHWDWAMSVRLTKALSSGKRFNILARACICSTLIAIDGPLLQRASSVTHVSYRNPTTLGVTLSPEVPHGYSGEYKAVRASLIGVPENFGTADAYELLMNPDFSPILAEWAGGDPISIKLDSGSPDQISAHIQAPALARRRCRTSHFSGDYTELQNGRPTNVFNQMGVFVDFGLLTAPREGINMTVLFSTNRNCNEDNITQVTCELEPSIGLYPVTLQRSVATLVSPENPAIVAVANNTGVRPGDSISEGFTVSTMAGIVSAAQDRYNTEVSFGRVRRSPQSGSFQTGFFSLGFSDYSSNTCHGYRGPTEVLMAGLNDLMFRVGAKAATVLNNTDQAADLDQGLSMHQTVDAAQIGSHNVYTANYWYFLAAALLEFLCIACIMPLYWGYWRLGRSVSFSPLETAKAFDAPIFAHCHSNSLANKIASDFGERRVRYGPIADPLESGSEDSKTAEKLSFGLSSARRLLASDTVILR